MLNSILIILIFFVLAATIVTLSVVLILHKQDSSKTKQRYQAQTQIVIRTIESSQPILHDLHDCIDRAEHITRGTSASAEMRKIADEMRDIVVSLDDLILVQNIQEGLKILEQISSPKNEQ